MRNWSWISEGNQFFEATTRTNKEIEDWGVAFRETFDKFWGLLNWVYINVRPESND